MNLFMNLNFYEFISRSKKCDHIYRSLTNFHGQKPRTQFLAKAFPTENVCSCGCEFTLLTNKKLCFMHR